MAYNIENSLMSISSIDGRYKKDCKELNCFSEFSLIKNRVKVEILYLYYLSNYKVIREINLKEKQFLDNVYIKFTIDDAVKIKEIEEKIHHDVKAVECWIREKFDEFESLKDLKELIHFAVTSEDISNIAFNCMIKSGIEIYLKVLDEFMLILSEIIEENKSLPMLARTHGQPANCTTAGKELGVFLYRLIKERQKLKSFTPISKFNGAVGNFNSFYFACPNVDWFQFSKDFVESFGFEYNYVTTQIESHDYLNDLFIRIISINNILKDFSADIWMYILFGYFDQKNIKDEVGSSVMVHKINPFMFETAEGMLSLSNGELSSFIDKIQISKLQRDISNNAIMRTIGVPISFSFLAIKNIIRGVKRLNINKEKILNDLKCHPEILSEGILTIMKLRNIENSYEILKNIFRGNIDLNLNGFDEIKELYENLLKGFPENYLGGSIEITEFILKEYAESL